MFFSATTSTKRAAAAVAVILAFTLILTAATTLLQINQGGTGASTKAAAFLNLAPSSTAVGDLIYCSHVTTGNCDTWSKVAGNSSGTSWLQETSSGVPSWTTPSGSGVTSVTGTAPIVSSGGSTPAISLSIGAGLTTSAGSLTTVGQQPAQVSASFVGTPANGQVIAFVPVTFQIVLASGCTNMLAGAKTAATGTAAFTVKQLSGGPTGSATTYCTATWSASGNSAAITGAGGTLAAGDYLEIDGPSTADATLATIGFGVYGTR